VSSSEPRPDACCSDGIALGLLVLAEVEHSGEGRILVDDVANADNTKRRRIIRMIVSTTEEAPITIGPSHLENRPLCAEDMGADVALPMASG
jgi:hypothetical protein